MANPKGRLRRRIAQNFESSNPIRIDCRASSRLSSLSSVVGLDDRSIVPDSPLGVIPAALLVRPCSGRVEETLHGVDRGLLRNRSEDPSKLFSLVDQVAV